MPKTSWDISKGGRAPAHVCDHCGAATLSGAWGTADRMLAHPYGFAGAAVRGPLTTPRSTKARSCMTM